MAAILMAPQVVAQQPAFLTNGLVAYYPFSGNANDVVGANNGVVNYATLTTDRFNKPNQAYSFNGNNSGITVQNNQLFNFGGNVDFAIGLWAVLNAPTNVSPQFFLISKDEGGGLRNKWTFAVGGSENYQEYRQLYFQYHNPSTKGYWQGEGKRYLVKSNEWHQYFITKVGSVFTIYFDGDEWIKTTNATPILDNSAPLTIGHAENLSINGKIDDVRIYRRALSSDDVKSVYLYESTLGIVSITRQPDSVVSYIGDNVVLSVVATNATSYQWMKDGNVIPWATNSTLSITNVQPADLGGYRVLVSNDDNLLVNNAFQSNYISGGAKFLKYQAKDISFREGLVSSSGKYFQPKGLNENGVVIGDYYNKYENNTRQAAYTSQDGFSLNTIDQVGGSRESFGIAINNSGKMLVGRDADLAVFVYNSDGVKINLIDTMPGQTIVARSISTSGLVVGQIHGGGQKNQPFITGQNGIEMTGLGGFRDDFEGDAVAINDQGQVVGWSRIQSRDEQRAFITGISGLGMRDLGVLGGSLIQGSNSVATAVNNLGQVVGGSSLRGGDLHAFITETNGGKMRGLGTLGGIFSHAYDINDNGQVVGWSYTNLVSSPVSHAFVTGENGSGMFDLNSFVQLEEGVQLETADSINNRGQILAHGGGRSYLLTPTTVISSVATVEITCRDINTGLVAYYPFNGRAMDESGFGNHGVLNGATLTKDRFGYPNRAYHFDGASSIFVADSKSLNPTNGLTISVWFRADNWDGYNPRFVSKGGYNLCATLERGQKLFDFDIATSSLNRPRLTAPLTKADVWNHLVATYATNRMSIYVNGSLASVSYQTNGSIVRVPVKWGNPTEYYDLYIGQKPGDLKAANGYWIGDLDDIRIYSRSLSDCEVKTLHELESNHIVNRAPTLNALADVKLLQNAPSQTVNLSGIGSGAVDEVQVLTVTATSDNPGLIPNPAVTYTSPNAVGSLSYQPVAGMTGKATITVTVKDDGGVLNGGQDTFSRQFIVTVSPVNRAPTLNALADVKLLQNAPSHKVSLSGIGSGAVDEVQVLTVTATSDNPGLIPNPAVTYTSPNAMGSLTFQPVAGVTGKATITVTVKDDGGILNGGQDTFSRQFLVDVTKVDNQAPEIQIVSPQDGSITTVDSPITLVADAKDPDGTVLKVEFYQNNNQLIGTAASNPFQVTVNHLSEGKYTFYAKATDNSGLSAVSAQVTINVLGERRDVALIKVSSDDHFDLLSKYVSEVQLSTHQDSLTWRAFETSEISYEILSQYRVVIWNDPHPLRGVLSNEVKILKNLIDSGIGVYLIGPGIATSAQALGLSEQRDWVIISSVNLLGKKVQLNNINLKRQDDHGPFLDGFYGRVGEFNISGAIDQCNARENSDVHAVIDNSAVLISYPNMNQAEDGETRRVSQLVPVVGDGDNRSIKEREVFFKNALCWLVECQRCPVVNLAVRSNVSEIEPLQLIAGEIAKLKLEVTTQNAECPATGVRAVAEFSGTTTVVDAKTEQGNLIINGSNVYFSIGRIGVHKSVPIEISLKYNSPGVVTNKITAFANGMTSKSVIEFPQVYAVSVLPSQAPTINADRDVAGNLRLRMSGQNGITYILEKTTATTGNGPIQWSALKEFQLASPEYVHLYMIDAATTSAMFRVRKK